MNIIRSQKNKKKSKENDGKDHSAKNESQVIIEQICIQSDEQLPDSN